MARGRPTWRAAAVLLLALATFDGRPAAALPLDANDVLMTALFTHVVDAETGAINGHLGGQTDYFFSNVATDRYGNVFAVAQGQNYRVDRSDLSVSPVAFPFPDQIDAQGRLYTSVLGGPVMIDPATGNPTALGPSGWLLSIDDPLNAFAPDGDLLTLDPNTATITRTDAITSIVSLVTSGGLLEPESGSYPGEFLFPVAIATAPDGTIFALSQIPKQYPEAAITRVDLATGQQTRIGYPSSPGATDFFLQWLAVDGNGDVVAYGEDLGSYGELQRFDGTTGARTSLGLFGYGSGFRVLTIVPEPGTALLLGTGLALLGLRRTRRDDAR